MDFFLEFRKKNLSRTQNSPEDFPRTRPDTLSFPFLLTISRPPPGVSQNKKSPSHFCKALPARTPHNSDPTTRNRENLPKTLQPPKAYLFKTLPPRFFTKNVPNRLPEALPGPGKDQPPPQPSFPHNPHQPDEPRHLSRLPLDPAEQRRL